MHSKVEKIGVDPMNPITLFSDELCSVDIAPFPPVQISEHTDLSVGPVG